jgi:TolB protein
MSRACLNSVNRTQHVRVHRFSLRPRMRVFAVWELFFSICFGLVQSTSWAGEICAEQVYPPKAVDTGSDSFQNPACLRDGRLAFTVWHNGYNGWDMKGMAQIRRADIYIVNPSSRRKRFTVLGPKGVDKVNNIGHVAAGNYIAYNCNWSKICISNMKRAKDFRMFERPAGMVVGRFQEPVFDPTGQHIVFEWTKEEDEQKDRGTADICTMNRDGSNLRCAGYAGYNKQPDWSPKGDRIVFQRQCGEKCWHLWTAETSPDGTIIAESAVQLTKVHPINTDASWSPNGTRIIYSCGDDLKATVCVTDANSGDRPVMVPQVSAPYNGAISWCNDRYIYFEAGPATEPQQPTVICRVPAPLEKSNRAEITRSRQEIAVP